MKVRWSLAVFALGVAVFVASCVTRTESVDEYFVVGEGARRQEITRLLEILGQEGLDAEARLAAHENLAAHLLAAEAPTRLNLLLTTSVEDHPEDPFNAYYLLLVAQNYEAQRAFPFARHYYERIVNRFPDVSVRGRSSHFEALRALARLSEDPEARATYQADLMDRFPDQIDMGHSHYRLARTYEELGEWELAYEQYRRFLAFPETEIPGEPDAHRSIAQKVAFYDSNKNWTSESLSELVAEVRNALLRQSFWDLEAVRAKENFFAMSREQEVSDQNSEFDFDLAVFLTRSPWIAYANELEVNSNAREAYLRTWGWSHRIPTWYFYFRKVDFPADPEINGDWEWAGIFFGESL
jgi:tetratricopeptide (TPR) repeat protein